MRASSAASNENFHVRIPRRELGGDVRSRRSVRAVEHCREFDAQRLAASRNVPGSVIRALGARVSNEPGVGSRRTLGWLAEQRSATRIIDVSETGARKPAFNSLGWRAGNAIVSVLARTGLGPIHLLTTLDRATGRPRTVPVVPVDYDGRRWVVAPYGTVGWVRNARKQGRVRLRYGRASREYAIREVGADEAGPVLKRYVTVATKTRAHFQATKDSPVEDFVAEANRHPVFELIPLYADAATASTSPRPDP
jgi:deazaflavin-dependent oxidoreductase (nitroreductase family)